MTLKLDVTRDPTECALHAAPIKLVALRAIKATLPDDATLWFCLDCRREVIAASESEWLAEVHQARGVA